MTYQDLTNMLTSINIPVSYFKFPNDVTPIPPCLVYYFEGADIEPADNTNYSVIQHLVVEIVTSNKDFTTEANAESAFTAYKWQYVKTEEYIYQDDLYLITYEGDIILHG